MRALLAFAAAVLFPVTLAAQGWIQPRPGRPEGSIVRTRTEVSVRVEGRVASVEVDEWFQNRGGGLGEGDYLYPLPGEAVFSGFSLFQGDEELRGETMDAGTARGIYEEIVRRNRDPALIELAGHGLLRARVFPINPGETRRITLRYTQVMPRAGDALHFRYLAGARNGGVDRRVEGSAGTPRPVPEPGPLSFTLTAADGSGFRDPFSPTHELRVTRQGGGLTVRPAGTLSGDFALFLPLASGTVGMTLAAHRPSGEDGYFMLTLSPGQVRAAAVPRDLTVVVDVSGSMSGSKMTQARQALRQLLDTLEPRDRFRLIAFQSSVTSFAGGWTQATAAERERARRWIEDLRAEGGTNISGALEEAFRLPSPRERLPIVLFLTDGLPSVGERDPEQIARRAESSRGAARIFAFGVGYDVNTLLLDRLGSAGRGSTQYVQPGEDVEVAVATLAAKIRHPVLTDLEITDAPVRLREVYPAPLPDLFAGEELVILGRYTAVEGERRGALVLTGRRNGQVERFSLAAAFPGHRAGNDYIARLWGSRKVGQLTRRLRLEGRNTELEREIRETALRYGLLSEYTAHLVQEPMDRFTGRGRPARPVDVSAPAVSAEGFTGVGVAGGTARGVAGGTPQAARPAAPPPPVVGQAAVQASVRMRAREQAQSTADLAQLEETAAAAGGGDARAVAGRRFALRSSVWTDVNLVEGTPVVEVEPFSRAYFDLLALAPELRPYWSTFERVTVAGQRVAIRVAPGGRAEIGRTEAERIVREFRER